MAPKQFLIAASVAFTLTAANAGTVKISADATSNMSCSDGVCTPTADNAVMNVSEVLAMLTSGNLTVKSGSASHDELEVEAPISWPGSQRLTLVAGDSITIDKPVVVAGAGELYLTPNLDTGLLRFSSKGHVDFQNLTGKLYINGSPYRLFNDIRKLVSAFKFRHPPLKVALAQDINAHHHQYSTPPISALRDRFEGLGHIVSNFTIEDAADENVGFIGEATAYPSNIRNVGFRNARVTGAGSNQNVGVIVGQLSSVGQNLNGCFVDGTVNAGANSKAGGLAGSLSGAWIEHAHANVNVVAGDGAVAGGLVGAGGDAGAFFSYATGSVSGGAGSTLGGLFGSNVSDISGFTEIGASYATGAVVGGDTSTVGGLIGANTAGKGSNLELSYATGNVSAGSGSTVGGLLGTVVSTQIIYTYWDLDTSGVSDPSRGAGNVANQPGIAGLSDAALTSGLPTGFGKKFFDVKPWRQSGDTNGGYPFLRDLPPQ